MVQNLTSAGDALKFPVQITLTFPVAGRLIQGASKKKKQNHLWAASSLIIIFYASIKKTRLKTNGLFLFFTASDGR